VAVAPEPVKQDFVDDEILESVPNTMKAKVQLERERGTEIQGRNRLRKQRGGISQQRAVTTDPFVVSTAVLKVDPVLDFFPSASWCFWGVWSNRGETLLSFARTGYTKKEIKEWLQSQDTYTLHKPTR
jgi:hypothetical protein